MRAGNGRSRGGDPGSDHNSRKIADQTTNAHNSARPAEDADLLVAEIGRWLDSADLVILDALNGGNYTAAQACENALAIHTRVRRNLSLTRVAA